jgi:hypothetical protein
MMAFCVRLAEFQDDFNLNPPHPSFSGRRRRSWAAAIKPKKGI